MFKLIQENGADRQIDIVRVTQEKQTIRLLINERVLLTLRLTSDFSPAKEYDLFIEPNVLNDLSINFKFWKRDE